MGTMDLTYCLYEIYNLMLLWYQRTSVNYNTISHRKETGSLPLIILPISPGHQGPVSWKVISLELKYCWNLFVAIMNLVTQAGQQLEHANITKLPHRVQNCDLIGSLSFQARSTWLSLEICIWCPEMLCKTGPRPRGSISPHHSGLFSDARQPLCFVWCQLNPYYFVIRPDEKS